MITPKLKDEVLTFLCLHCQPERLSSFNPSEAEKVLNMDYLQLEAILRHFQRVGLIEDLNARHVGIHLIVRTEANDYYLRGGFTAQEELLEANINKLLLEVEQLKPSVPEKAERIANISSAIMAAIALFVKK